MAHEHGELGIGPASLVRRLASVSLRQALRIREWNNDLRRGPDLRGLRGFGGRPVRSLIVTERRTHLVSPDRCQLGLRSGFFGSANWGSPRDDPPISSS